MYDLKACNHGEDFANWIVEKLSQRAKRGQITFFPAFNARHLNEADQRELLPENSVVQNFELGKRQELLNLEVGFARPAGRPSREEQEAPRIEPPLAFAIPEPGQLCRIEQKALQPNGDHNPKPQY